MLRIVLIGPGSKEFHFKEILGIDMEEVEQEEEKIAQALHSANIEIALLPDKGISLDIARKFKALGGKVICLAPLSDKFPGIGHLKQYMETQVNGRLLFDEFIDTGDWPRQDLNMALYGDVVLSLGRSPGTEGERQYGVYMYKIVSGFKSGVSQGIETIHKQARAGKTIPYTIVIYTPFFSSKLPLEDEAYAKRFGVNLVHIKNSGELEKRLRDLNV